MCLKWFPYDQTVNFHCLRHTLLQYGLNSDGWRFQFIIFLLNEKKCIQTRLIITIIQLALVIVLF